MTSDGGVAWTAPAGTPAPVHRPCQYFGHPLWVPVRAVNRVRFYCTRCTRGSTPDTQTDLDMCHVCQRHLEVRENVGCPECGYVGTGVDFIHPDGPPTGRPMMHRGAERS